MTEKSIISKILKNNIIHYYNYLTNKKNNIIAKTYMDKIARLKKKKYICNINVKYLNNHSTNYFEIIEQILNSLTNKTEGKFA